MTDVKTHDPLKETCPICNHETTEVSRGIHESVEHPWNVEWLTMTCNECCTIIIWYRQEGKDTWFRWGFAEIKSK